MKGSKFEISLKFDINCCSNKMPQVPKPMKYDLFRVIILMATYFGKINVFGYMPIGGINKSQPKH